MNTVETFAASLNKRSKGGCWIFTGALSVTGYGRYSYRNKMHAAHRLAYELFVGDIPKGLTIDHLCRNRACCNPAHLEAVSQGENVLRGNTLSAANKAKSHCYKGHAFNEQNTIRIVRYGRERRLCRRCKNDSNNARRKRNKTKSE